jgi:hypothetical protein
MSDRLEDVVDIALRVAEALEKVGASYFVGGAYLRDWAVRLALTDLLDRATAEVGA